MADVKRLSAAFDGGPNEDPREQEEEELLHDGEEEETKKPEEDDNWEFEDEGGEKGGKKAAEPEVKAEPKKKPETKPEAEDEVEIEEAEKEPPAEPEKEQDASEKAASAAEAKAAADERTKFKSVPYPRFRRELARRQQQALELAETKRQLEELTKRVGSFETSARGAADPEPDRAIDPVAHLEWQVRRQSSELETLKAAQKAPASPTAISAPEVPILTAAYLDSVEALKAEKPDFDAAYKHAVTQAFSRIAAQNPQASQAQVEAELQRLELIEVKNAIAAGIDPAERIYSVAVGLGYKPAKETKVADSKQQDVKSKVIDAAAEAARKKRASSIAGQGRTITRRPLTESDVEGMSNAELERFMDRNSGRSNPLAP